jgi:predicted PurR-regulated permease PerM
MSLKNYKIDYRIVLVIIFAIAWLVMTFLWLYSKRSVSNKSETDKIEQMLLQNNNKLKETQKSIDSLQSILSSRSSVKQVITNVNNTYTNEKNRVTKLPYDSAVFYLTNWIDSLRYTKR